jgi:hypothetical protein
MELFNSWSPQKNLDYQYLDGVIREYFDIGGVSVFLHKYIGTIDQGNLEDPSQPSATQSSLSGVSEIQDLLFQENRDRRYDPQVYELKAIYSILDTEFDIRQYGQFLESDTYFLTFHLNDVTERIGRRLMPGDVFEMVHLRDDALLDENAPAINKFYQITDVNRASIGWSVTWRPHILRAKISPITDSQQFSQILNMPANQQVGGDGLDGTGVYGLSGAEGVEGSDGNDGNVTSTGDMITGGSGTLQTNVSSLISDFRSKMAVSTAISQEAERMVPYRNFNATHIWIVPGSETGGQRPWIFTGDGIPPNQSAAARSGTQLPQNAVEGDYFLRVPPADAYVDVGEGLPVLFRFTNGLWIYQEVDFRMKWECAHRILASFVNNRNITDVHGHRFPEKQLLSKVVLPKADF